MAHDFTEHEEYKKWPKPPDEVHAFYIEFDLGNGGKLVQKKEEFYDELFDDLVPFAFGNKKMSNKNSSEMKREAAKKYTTFRNFQVSWIFINWRTTFLISI